MIKFNKSIFEIAEPKDKYKHFLVFLVRKFYWKNFNWTFSRTNFINTWITKYWYKKKTIEQVFDKGIKNNSFVLKSYIKRNKKYYILKSNINNKSNSLIIWIEEKLLNKVHFMSDFYTFCFVLVASYPNTKYFFNKFNDTKLNKIIWRTLEEIWRSFWNMPKNWVFYHIEKAKELFNWYFNVISRVIPFNKLELWIANLYYLDSVKFRFFKTFDDWINKSKLYRSNFLYDFENMSHSKLKNTYWIDVKIKNWIKNMKYKFWSDIDFWNQFFNKNWRFLYEEFYNNYHQNMELIIWQYDSP